MLGRLYPGPILALDQLQQTSVSRNKLSPNTPISRKTVELVLLQFRLHTLKVGAADGTARRGRGLLVRGIV